MTTYLDLLDESLPERGHPRRNAWRDYALSGEQRSDPVLDRIEQILDLSGRILLDLGCGDGGFAVAATRRGCSVIALDVCTKTLQRASARCLWRQVTVDLCCGSGLLLPILDGTCDAVILQDVIEHVPNPSTLLQETFRVLRRGGVCYVSAVNSQYLPYILSDPHWGVFGITMLPRSLCRFIISHLLKLDPNYDVWQLPSQLKLEEWLSSSGFCIVSDTSTASLRFKFLKQPVLSILAVKPR